MLYTEYAIQMIMLLIELFFENRTNLYRIILPKPVVTMKNSNFDCIFFTNRTSQITPNC